MVKPGPKQKVSKEDIRALIVGRTPTGQSPVMTVNDIAEHFDVASQTIRPKMEDVETAEGVQSRKVGQTTVYWYDIEEVTPPSLEDLVDAYQKDLNEDLLLRRAEWLYSVEQTQAALEMDQSHPGVESTHLLYALVKYIDVVGQGTFIRFGRAIGEKYEEYGLDDGTDPLANFDENDFYFDRETVEYYLYDAELMADSIIGQVNGIADFERMKFEIRDELVGKEDELPDDISPEQWEEVLPSPNELIAAGTVVDRFVTGLFGWEW